MKRPFLRDTVVVTLDKLLPSRNLKPEVKSTRRYKMIAASVREIGIVEPLIVCAQPGGAGAYVVLDGHVRVEVLRELGESEVECLVSTDDENCTYNVRVSHLAPIQECRMILRAIKDGVSEDVIARTLNVSPLTIRESRTKLSNIVPEALERLKDKPVADMALRVLKKVKPYRQTEMAEMMVLSNTYTATYARTLLAATSPAQLVSPPKADTRPEQLAQLEVEMRAIEREFVVLEETYSRDTLNLQLARGYLKTLLQNARVNKYLTQKHGELLAQLQKVVEVASLDG